MAFNFSKLEKKEFFQIFKSDVVIDYENLDLYKGFFKEKFKSKPIKFLNSKLTIRENNKKIFSVKNINLVFNSSESLDSVKLTGDFLTDKISINFQNKHKQKKPLKLSSAGRLQLRKNLGPGKTPRTKQGEKGKTIQIIFRNKNNQRQTSSTAKSNIRGSSINRPHISKNLIPSNPSWYTPKE